MPAGTRQAAASASRPGHPEFHSFVPLIFGAYRVSSPSRMAITTSHNMKPSREEAIPKLE